MTRDEAAPGGGADCPNAAVGMRGFAVSAFALNIAMRSLRLPEGTRERWVSLVFEEEEAEDWKASRRDLREAGLAC